MKEEYLKWLLESEMFDKAAELKIKENSYIEAIKYLIVPTATSTKSSTEYLKQKEAYELAIKALEKCCEKDNSNSV